MAHGWGIEIFCSYVGTVLLAYVCETGLKGLDIGFYVTRCCPSSQRTVLRGLVTVTWIVLGEGKRPMLG